MLHYIWVIPPKIGFRFLEYIIYQKFDIENLKVLFLFHKLSFYILGNLKKTGFTVLILFWRAKCNPNPTDFVDYSI